MLKKILFKAAAGTAALGSALALTTVAAPATISAAPEWRNVACSYPAEEQSTTELQLLRSMGRFGDINRAVVTVTTDGAPADGTVRLQVNGTTRATKPLNDNGTATFGLPRYLRAQATHSITATFVPADDCVTTQSDDAGSYTVYRRGTQTAVAAPDRVRGRRPVVHVDVASALPRDPRGKVRVVVRRDGRPVANRLTRVGSDGEAHLRFRKLRVGTYRVRVRYLGAMNFTRSAEATAFRVRRPR